MRKSLQELEGVTWGKPDRSDTGLVKTCHRLYRIRLQDFTPGDFRVMIAQQIGLDFLVPLALEHLERDPLVEGSFYPCDLLVSVLSINSDFWRRHPDLLERAAHVYEDAIALFPSRPDVATKTVTRSVTHAHAEFQKSTEAALQGAPANVRPAFPFRVWGDFGRGRCAPPLHPAHVAELGSLDHISVPYPTSAREMLTPRSLCTWVCSVSPLSVCIVVLLLTLSFRAGLDGSLPRFLEIVLLLSAFVALYIAPLAWIVFLLIRDFRLPLQTHFIQVGVYVGSWLMTVPLLALLESQHLPGWFLD